MALVTQENIDTVLAAIGKVGEVGKKLDELTGLLLAVHAAVQQDGTPNFNAARDWDDTLALYLPDYDTKIAELKTLAQALDRWPT